VTPEFLEFARVFGLPVALLMGALIAGAMGFWSFRPSVDAVMKAKDGEIQAKNDEISYRERRIERLEERIQNLEALLWESQERADRFADLAGAPRLPPGTNARPSRRTAP
jgi:hypothetical protein